MESTKIAEIAQKVMNVIFSEVEYDKADQYNVVKRQQEVDSILMNCQRIHVSKYREIMDRNKS